MRKTILTVALALTVGLGAQAQRGGDELFNATPAERRVLNNAGLLSLRVWSGALPAEATFREHLPPAARVIGAVEYAGTLSALLEVALGPDAALESVVVALGWGGWGRLADDRTPMPTVFEETRALPVAHYEGATLCREAGPMLFVVATPLPGDPLRSEVSVRQFALPPCNPLGVALPQGYLEERAATWALLPTLQLPAGVRRLGGEMAAPAGGEYRSRFQAQGDTSVQALWDHLRPQLAAQGWSWAGEPRPQGDTLQVTLRREPGGEAAQLTLGRTGDGSFTLEFSLSPAP